MNITFVISTLAKGGSERVTSILANRFSRGQYRVTILTLFNSNISYEINPEIDVISLDQKLFTSKKSFILKLYYYLKRIFDLGRYFKDKDENIVVIGSDILNATIVISKLIFNLKNKLILTIRSNPMLSRGFFLRKIIYFFYKYADAVVVQSITNKNFIASKIRKNKIARIDNLTTFTPTTIERVKKKYDFLTIGRMHSIKNQLDIVKAIKILNSSNSNNFNLCIVGRDQGNQKEIINYINNHKLNDNIFLKGEVDDIHNFYNTSKVLVHYSNYEGQSNVIIEAITLGLPIIVSNWPGVEQDIINDYNGLIVERNNPNLLAEKMEKLISNQGLQKRMSANNYKISDKYSLEKIFSNWEELINGLK